MTVWYEASWFGFVSAKAKVSVGRVPAHQRHPSRRHTKPPSSVPSSILNVRVDNDWCVESNIFLV